MSIRAEAWESSTRRSPPWVKVMMISVPIGARLFHVIPVSWYRPFAYAVLLGAGALALFG